MRLPLKPLALAAMLLAGTITVNAKDINPADYPLRIHIFNRVEHTSYHRHVQQDSQGDGRANLFADGEVHAVDFSFDCNDRLLVNPGWETYMARWKKPGKELTVVMPVLGKLNSFYTCNFDTNVKDSVYFRHNGSLDTQTENEAKAWMEAHHYDPEHGKDVPSLQ